MLRAVEGQLIAQYLIRIVDRVGLVQLQSIPNSGASREPFVLFAHPQAQIVIEPVGTGPDTQWKFSATTTKSLRQLFRAVDELPPSHALDSRLIPWLPMFWLRDHVKAYVPALLANAPGRARLEYWQLLLALLGVGFLLSLAFVLGRTAFWLLCRPAIKHHITNTRRLAAALGIGLAAAVGTQVMPMIGLPALAREYSLPVVGTVILLVLTYAGWSLVMAITSVLRNYAERTEVAVDNILLSFGAGLARLALVVVVGLSLGDLWSLPTTGLLAGLGIGGLAVAFASRETLANVLGAGILLSDRPFRTGERIVAGDVHGWIEDVGLRSTRIRTLADTQIIVPNSKLADSMINNLGTRRRSLTTRFMVTPDSPPERLRAFMDTLMARIRSDKAFVDKSAEVIVTDITTAGIELEVWVNLNSKDYIEYRMTRHELILDILSLVKREGLTLSVTPKIMP